MTTINYGLYTPTQLKVVSLGINISDETNNTLNLTNEQSLIVGERIQDIYGVSNQKTYGLIVNTQGIAINTTTSNRALPYNNYAAYIDGDVRVTGNIYLDGSITCNMGLVNGTTSNNYWTMAQDGTYTNIYYNENITVGNRSAAFNNNYSVNVYQTANTDVEQVQLSLQNLQASQLRMGIIGTAYNSPVIFNTNANSTLPNEDALPSNGTGAIEFHIGRDQQYFSNVYFAEDGSTTGLPDYSYMPPPHFQLDYAGNVGINTCVNNPVSFTIRTANTGIITYTPVTTPMNLNVEGSTYSKNLLIYDYESASICNIDSLYVRSLGVTFKPNQILPGTFARGGAYTFPESVNITADLNIYGTENVNNIIANNSLINTASFCNDTLFNRDIIVNQSIRLRGQIFTEVFTGLSEDGSSNYGFEMIQFTPASPSYSNINTIGSGIATPGRLGVGINPSSTANNPVNTQFAIYKNNPNIWEVSMFDKSDVLNGSVKAGFIGHPYVASTFNNGIDASLVFATPSYNDPDYSGIYTQLVQNIYFYPGIDMSPTAPPIVSGAVPPTLGIFNKPGNIVNSAIRAVGINTYSPLSELDVNGSITFSGNIYYNPTHDATGNIQLAIWKTEIYNAILEPGAPELFYTGISYIPTDPDASHVGINTVPNYLYGLVVGGNTKLNNGLYTIDTNGVDRKAAFWQDNRDSVTINNNVSPATQNVSGGLFTWANAGIGVKVPNTNLEIRDNYDKGTRLQLSRGTGGSSNAYNTSLIYQGFTPHNSWTFQADHINKYFQIGNGDTPFNNANNVRYMWMRPKPFTNDPQIVIGGSLNIFNSSSNPDINALLTVGGSMSVLGNVSISGQFIINGNTLLNSNIPGSLAQTLNSDDVFIGGGNIQFSPGTDYLLNQQSVVIGTPYATYVGPNGPVPILGNQIGISDPDVGKTLRVYGSKTSTQPIIASFQGSTENTLLEIVQTYNGTTQSLQFGAFYGNSPSFNGTQFAFVDGATQHPYMSFQKQYANNDGYVGFGVPFSEAPSAITHLYTEGTGANMLRLTKGVFTINETTDDAPQIELQKNYEASTNNLENILQAPTSWVFKGPCASWNQKLSFIYNEAIAPNSFTSVSTEVLTVTKNGCVGIGNTQPTFALDIINVDNIGSLRLSDSGNNPAPQIVFQSGSQTYGSDSLRDFRMAASNNTFTFDSKTSTNHYFILDVDEKNNIGIGQPANCNFDVSLNGIVNIGQGLYLNGNPLFATGNILQNGVTISANNVFITPDTSYPSPNGGVVINGTQPTGNLFNIFSGNNANMMVLDSAYPRAQMYMRTSNLGIQNMYRISMNTTAYTWQYYPNCYSSLTITDDNNGYENVMSIAPTLRSVYQNLPEFDLNINGSLVLNSFNNPGIYFGDLPTNPLNMGSISGSNENICIMPKTVNNGVGIGTYYPSSNFHVVGTSLFDGYTTYNYNSYFNANVYVHGNSFVEGNQITGVMNVNPSDIRLKKDIVKIENALEKVKKLSGYTYSLINEPYASANPDNTESTDTARRYTGLIAQEVEEVLPEVILQYTPENIENTENSKYLSIAYGNMMGIIVEAIKELSTQISEIKEELKIK